MQLPVGLQPRLRQALRSGTLSVLACLPRPLPKAFLKCLYCHYVFDDQVGDFERAIQRLKRVGRFVDAATVMEIAQGKVPITERLFHLSFDDGFKNVCENALPILKRHQVPAVIFIPTAFVGSDWESASDYCLRIAHYKSVVQMATWDELRRARDDGFEIGSHTRTHCRLSDISADRISLGTELAGSKEDIERELGTECRFFSWPFGRMADVDEWSLRECERVGYQAVFGAFRGTVVSGQTSKWRLPRHHFEAQWPLSHIHYFASRADR